MASRVISFLRGEVKDDKNRSLTELQSMPDWKLERTHDAIQWLFPTDIPSRHIKDAPVLTPNDVDILATDLAIHDTIQMSLTRMIWFYEKNDYWISQCNHNFLRITRILRCLWLANMKHDYVGLQKALDAIFIDYADIIGEETYLYWKNANDDKFMKDPEYRAKILAYYNEPAPKQIVETNPKKTCHQEPATSAKSESNVELVDEEEEILN